MVIGFFLNFLSFICLCLCFYFCFFVVCLTGIIFVKFIGLYFIGLGVCPGVFGSFRLCGVRGCV